MYVNQLISSKFNNKCHSHVLHIQYNTREIY